VKMPLECTRKTVRPAENTKRNIKAGCLDHLLPDIEGSSRKRLGRAAGDESCGVGVVATVAGRRGSWRILEVFLETSTSLNPLPEVSSVIEPS